jgi:hypothetical protein
VTGERYEWERKAGSVRELGMARGKQKNSNVAGFQSGDPIILSNTLVSQICTFRR